MQSKKLLFTLILMASCFGILGMGGESNAACSVYAGISQEKTSYILGETVTINFKDAPAGSVLNFYLYPGGGSGKKWEWDVHQSGYVQHTLLSTDTTGTYEISLYGGNGTCNAIKYITVKSEKTCAGEGGVCCNIHENGCRNFTKDASSLCSGDDNYCCKIGDCYSDCELKKGQECLDISKCTGGVIVIYKGPRECSIGTCIKKESCQIASTVPQLPTTPTTPTTVEEPTTTTSGATVNLSKKPLSEILEDLIKWLLQIVILIAILMIIISGVMYMISAGDQTKADTAKKALTYAILGLLVVALAYAIVNTLVNILTG